MSGATAPTPASRGESPLEAILIQERDRIVRLCAHLTGDSQAAEDLAQETLTEAWRLRDRLTASDGAALWLNAIARNVCLRWTHRQRRDRSRLALVPSPDDSAAPDPLADLPDPESDPATLIERMEVAGLLDQALALLPDSTRHALLAAYGEGTPQADLAARLGMSPGALRARLLRGRQELQRALTTRLRDDAIAFDLTLPDTPTWRETRIWCPFCGARPLEARIDRDAGDYAFRCSGPCVPGMTLIGAARDPDLLGAVTSPKALITRQLLALSTAYRAALASGEESPCPGCGAPVRIERWRDGSGLPNPLWRHGIVTVCRHCGARCDSASPWHLAIDTPEAVRFWRRYPRMRALPVQQIERAGRPAIVTGFESVGERARLEIVSARDTWETLHVAGEVAR